MSTTVTVTVPRIDLQLLRAQRDQLIDIVNEQGTSSPRFDQLDGVINLLDVMLDIGEGFAINLPGMGVNQTESIRKRKGKVL